MGLKEDSSFFRFVTMGAVAADAVRQCLNTKHGHEMIELERLSMANKLWQTKVKRLRLPDLLCVRCGLRVESKGKSKLGIILSHAEEAGRTWDGGGLRDDDLLAFARVDIDQEPPTHSQPVFFRVADVRTVENNRVASGRKASSEGSEISVEWKTWVPSQDGTFEGIDDRGRLYCAWTAGGGYRYYQWDKWPAKHVYLAAGDPVVANETMVAGIVAAPGKLNCPADSDLAAALRASDPTDRYTAIRAAGVTLRHDLEGHLRAIEADEAENWRLRLEAAASLARLEPGAWIATVAAQAFNPGAGDDLRIESVFVLAEIPTDAAAEALAGLAEPDERRFPELRAAAVWGLGQGVQPRADLALRYTVDDDDLVALHAITGMSTLPDDLVPTLLGWISEDNDRRAAVAAAILGRHKAIRPLLEAVYRGGTARLWALRALGDLDPVAVRDQASELLTPEIEEALTPMWVGQRDWLRTRAAEEVQRLDVQKMRFNPFG